MVSFAVDTSVAITWLLHDEKTAASEALLDRLVNGGEKAAAPPLLFYELANAMAMAVKRGRIGNSAKRGLLDFFGLLPVEPDGDSTRLVLSSTHLVAEKHGLTLYDASYLELALRRGLPLATNDAALIRAALAEGVRLEKTS
ncbi:MAG: PIN domain-containing protein [Verrucomicrobiaceae bacterium]|nr:MAG: PIN domain-containing protein [Verrucomicrobiaceae bacterium]